MLSVLQPCQEKVNKKHEAHKQEMRKSRTISTDYKVRQDLEEGDADRTKICNEFKRGELLKHGEDIYNKIKPDLRQ